MATQRDLAKAAAYKVTVSADGQRAEVSAVIEEVLRQDLEEHGGEVFHQGSTPRNSARRALYDVLPAETLLVRDGYGYVRFRLDALRDVVIQGDAWEVLKLIPPGVLSCIISDAPTDHLEGHMAVGTTTRMVHEQHFQVRNLDAEILAEFYRVLKPGGYLCLYMPPFQKTALGIWRTVLEAVGVVGFLAVREVAWVKGRSMGYRWTGAHEPVLCFAKPLPGGKLPPCEDKSATSVIEASSRLGNDRTPYTDYAEGGDLPQFLNTEKPLAVARHLLRVAKDPGGLLLDCFAGSGGPSVVAHEFGMSYVAVEFEERNATKLLMPRLERAGRPATARIVVEVA